MNHAPLCTLLLLLWSMFLHLLAIMRSLKPSSPALKWKMPHPCSLNHVGILVTLYIMTVMTIQRASVWICQMFNTFQVFVRHLWRGIVYPRILSRSDPRRHQHPHWSPVIGMFFDCSLTHQNRSHMINVWPGKCAPGLICKVVEMNNNRVPRYCSKQLVPFLIEFPGWLY